MTRKQHLGQLCPLLILLAFFALVLQPAGAQTDVGRSPESKDSLESPFAALRLGIIVSPAASIDGGLDVTFPHLKIGKEWVSRLDIDLAARFNSRSFGSRRDASVGMTFCQVYTPGGVNRGRLFAGAGLGYFVGPKSGVGSKLFVGTNLSRVVSIEVEGQWPGDSTARLALVLRASAL